MPRFITGCSHLKLLRSGLKLAEQIDFINLLDRARNPLTRICEAAIENGIETEFVRRLSLLRSSAPRCMRSVLAMGCTSYNRSVNFAWNLKGPVSAFS